MPNKKCPGLPASWLNGWLAAVGATVLNTGIRLHWTEERSPVAVLSTASGDPVEALLASWPDHAGLGDLPIAESWRGMEPMRRQVSVDTFASRVRKARGHPYCWSLSSTMTDLSVEENGEVAHSPFDPPGPGTIKWLHHRLLDSHSHVTERGQQVRATLAGRAIRVKRNGLGFDMTRLGSLADKGGRWVDPVVEVLAFFGLAVFPVRGVGGDARLGPASRRRAVPRGWRWDSGSRNELRFAWPAWRQPLDQAGIDALFDVWQPQRRAKWSLAGIHAGWRSVRYQARSSADPTRAYGAERL